jgi:CheY-like chemotaxis protein/HPt (histidine-containing phosphotransfer) domain-containing protein
MGGRIWFESEQGQGSTFFFTACFGLRGAGSLESVAEPTCLLGLRILVVDDNSTNQLILQEILTRWGARIALAESASAALAGMNKAAAAGSPFAVVLSDVMMPSVDGFQLAERIKRHPVLSGTPVILLSSADRQPDANRCRQLGVAAYLSKPVKHSELRAAIQKVMEPSSNEATAQTRGCDRGQRPSATCQSRPLTILLVEDNATNRMLAVALLEKEGHRVEMAHNGREALAVLASRAFDVVLMDVQMPEMDGFEATAHIREQERSTGAHIPIVAMTAHAMKGDRERCLGAGMDGYVSKPIHAKELHEALANVTPSIAVPEQATHTSHLVQGVDTRQAASTRMEPIPAEPPADVLDKAALVARLGGREERLSTFIQIFLDESSQHMAELDDAIIRNDASSLRRPAHSLKGSAGIFGALSLVEAAVALESLGQVGELSGAAEAYCRLETEFRKLKAELTALLSQ